MNLFTFLVLETCFTITITGTASLTAEDYVHLISDIYKSCKLSYVTFMHFTEDQDIPKKNLIFNIQVLLSKEKMTTSIMNLEIIPWLTNSECPNSKKMRKDARSMSVFFLNSETDVDKMKLSSKCMFGDKIIDLVLFVKTDKNTSLESCINPVGNPFFLKEGTSLFVKCYEDTSIWEWYSLNEYQMRVDKKAVWKPETGLILKSENLLFSYRNVLNGKVLFSATVELTEKMRKYFDNLRLAFELAGNFTIKNIEMEKKFDKWIESSLSWKSSTDLIVDGKADLALSWFALINPRNSHVHYSTPIIKVENVLLIRKPKTRILVSWSAYFKPFTSEVWIALLLSIIITQAISVFMKTRTKQQNDLYQTSSILENIFYIYGLYCQQNILEFPKTSSLRIFYCSVSFFTFTVLSCYSASFVSELTTIDQNLPFKSIEGLSEVKSHKLVVLPNTPYYKKFKDAENFPWKEAGRLLMEENKLPKNIIEAIDMICRNNVALYTDEFVLHKMYNRIKTFCPTTIIFTGYFDSYAMILRKNSPYTRSINDILIKLKASGILKNMKSTLYRRTRLVSSVDKPQNTYFAVTFLDIALLLAILLGSVVFSLIILCFENLYFWFNKRKTVKISILPRCATARLRRHRV